jgi:hypothetical protein
LPCADVLFRLAAATLAVTIAGNAAAIEPLEMLPDSKARARIGDLKLYHDPAAWRVDGGGDFYAVRCRGVECDDPLMTIGIVPGDRSACGPGAVIDRSAADYPDAWKREATTAGGAIRLTVHVATLDLGCRNRAGSPVYACTRHNGRVYWFEAPGEMCRTTVRETEALLHLLNGLSAAEATDD